MRTEAEIRMAVAQLKNGNNSLFSSMERLTRDGEAFDELQIAFNANGCYIAALEWMLGADTLKFTKGDSA